MIFDGNLRAWPSLKMKLSIRDDFKFILLDCLKSKLNWNWWNTVPASSFYILAENASYTTLEVRFLMDYKYPRHIPIMYSTIILFYIINSQIQNNFPNCYDPYMYIWWRYFRMCHFSKGFKIERCHILTHICLVMSTCPHFTLQMQTHHKR